MLLLNFHKLKNTNPQLMISIFFSFFFFIYFVVDFDRLNFLLQWSRLLIHELKRIQRDTFLKEGIINWDKMDKR